MPRISRLSWRVLHANRAHIPHIREGAMTPGQDWNELHLSEAPAVAFWQALDIPVEGA
jgi:hypothetical protein